MRNVLAVLPLLFASTISAIEMNQYEGPFGCQLLLSVALNNPTEFRPRGGRPNLPAAFSSPKNHEDGKKFLGEWLERYRGAMPLVRQPSQKVWLGRPVRSLGGLISKYFFRKKQAASRLHDIEQDLQEAEAGQEPIVIGLTDRMEIFEVFDLLHGTESANHQVRHGIGFSIAARLSGLALIPVAALDGQWEIIAGIASLATFFEGTATYHEFYKTELAVEEWAQAAKRSMQYNFWGKLREAERDYYLGFNLVNKEAGREVQLDILFRSGKTPTMVIIIRPKCAGV